MDAILKFLAVVGVLAIGLTVFSIGRCSGTVDITAGGRPVGPSVSAPAAPAAGQGGGQSAYDAPIRQYGPSGSCTVDQANRDRPKPGLDWSPGINPRNNICTWVRHVN